MRRKGTEASYHNWQIRKNTRQRKTERRDNWHFYSLALYRERDSIRKTIELTQTCHSGLAQNQYKWQGKSVFGGGGGGGGICMTKEIIKKNLSHS